MECTWGEKIGDLARRKAMESLSAYEARQQEMARQWEASRKIIAFKMIRETLEVAICRELAED